MKGGSRLRRSDLLDRWVTDLEMLQDTHLRFVFPFSAALLVATVVLPLAFWMEPLFGSVLLIGYLMMGVLLPWRSYRLACKETGSQLVLGNRLRRAADEWRRGREELAVLGCDGRFRAGLKALGERIRRHSHRRQGHLSGEEALQELGSALIQVTLLLTLIPFAVTGDWSGPLLGAAFLGAIASLEAFQGLQFGAWRWREIQHARRRLDLDRCPTADCPVIDPAAPAPYFSEIHDLRIDHLSAGYARGRLVVRDCSLHLRRGRPHILLGPSGEGKSTLWAALSGQLPMIQGNIRMGDKKLPLGGSGGCRTSVSLQRQVSVWFDAPLRVNLCPFGLKIDDEVIHNWLQRLGLAERLADVPLDSDEIGWRLESLSGGEKQRLAVIRAVLNPAPVLLFDEPTAQLDSFWAGRVWEVIREEATRRVVGVATHQVEAIQPDDPVTFLLRGRVVQQGIFSQCRQEKSRPLAQWAIHAADIRL